MRQKVLSILLALLMVFNMFPVTALANSQANDFTDMPNNWATEAFKKAVDNGLLKGYADKGKNLIKADEPLKRAEMSAVVNRAFGAVKTAELSGVTDVPSTAWYASDMAKAVMMGTFMKDTTMRPESNITRQEVFVVLARAFKVSSDALEYKALENYSDNADIAAWAKKDLNAMVEAGYVQGSDGKLNPNANISRAEFATVMYNLVKLYIDMPSEVTDINPSGNVLIRVPGVTLKNITIEGDLIIADGVGEGDVTLDNVKVEGRTVVRGGGENSIIIKGSSDLGKVIVCKVDGKVRIAVEGAADVEVIYIDDGSDDVLVEGVIGTLEVAGNNITAIATKAFLTNAVISGDNSTIILRTKSSMKEGTITGNASKIIVDKGATADKITIVGSDVKVEGNGTVKKVEVKASGDNSSITTPNTRIETAKGAEGVTAAGDAPVKSGTTATNNNTGTWIVTSSASSSGGTSTVPVSAINIVTTPDVMDGVNNDAVVEIKLTTATSGADIYYTTDGSTPTASSTKYSVPFVVEADNAEGETIIVKAIGVMARYTNSAVAVKEIVFKPASISVTAIRVSSNPAKITYYEGESLALAGLRVELTYSDSSSEYVELGDFAAKGITTDPVNGTVLSIAEHNDTRISVSCNGKSAQSGDKLSVLAATPSEFIGGDGTSENPYQVATVEQLDNVRNHLDKHFILVDDIDLSEYANWIPIGNVYASQFYGSFDGNGHTIRNMKVTSSDGLRMFGLFGYVTDATIKNLQIEDAYVVPSNSYEQQVGILAGYTARTTISNCSTSGTVGGGATYLTGFHVGGLVGQIVEGTVVDGCYSMAKVISAGSGLVDDAQAGTTIKNSYSSGTVSNGAGFVGSIYGTVKNCYTISIVSSGNLFASYISDSADVTGCYYQNVAEGPVPVGSGSVTGIIGIDEVAMKNQTTFIGWDFINIWDIDPGKNEGYPFLR